MAELGWFLNTRLPGYASSMPEGEGYPESGIGSRFEKLDDA